MRINKSIAKQLILPTPKEAFIAGLLKKLPKGSYIIANHSGCSGCNCCEKCHRYDCFTVYMKKTPE